MCSLPYFSLLLMTTMLTSQAQPKTDIGGWIPLSADEVYSKSRMSLKAIMRSSQIPINNADANRIQSKLNSGTAHEEWDNSNIHGIRSKAIKLVKPEINTQFGREDIVKIEPETITSVDELQNINEEIVKHDSDNSQNDDHQKTRKSKSITDHTLNVNVNKVLIDQNSKISDGVNDLKRRFTKDIDQNGNLYKVTEDPEDADNIAMMNPGYFYTPPTSNLNNPEQNNITHILWDILSRHNIKPEDELPNYTLSRKVKTQDSVNAFMFIPVPLRVLPQFNNLKQLSVDPLLAVLMSNYGYYFPGSYGVHGGYRNLYGHLASNNIHNNKPFGSYKIFSDTDSSN